MVATMIIRFAPTRPMSQPVMGAIANIPSVCAIMTYPIVVNVPSKSLIWIGVMTMTTTMTTWLTTIAAIESCTTRDDNNSESGRAAAFGSVS